MGQAQRLDRRRLALVAARFDSPYDGERLAALHLASAMLARGGATWADVIGGGPTAAPTEPATRRGTASAAPPQHTPDVAATLARAPDGVLTAWEYNFLQGCLTFRRLSERQREMLAEIQAKVARAAAQ